MSTGNGISFWKQHFVTYLLHWAVDGERLVHVGGVAPTALAPYNHSSCTVEFLFKLHILLPGAHTPFPELPPFLSKQHTWHASSKTYCMLQKVPRLVLSPCPSRVGWLPAGSPPTRRHRPTTRVQMRAGALSAAGWRRLDGFCSVHVRTEQTTAIPLLQSSWLSLHTRLPTWVPDISIISAGEVLNVNSTAGINAQLALANKRRGHSKTLIVA